MKKKCNKWFAVGFCSLLAAFSFINLITPQKAFSENENRYLTQLPEPTQETVLSGQFAQEFESYSTDQFWERDFWVRVKAEIEKITGKKENDGVYFADDGYLIEKPAQLNTQLIDNTIESFKKFDSLGKYDVSFTLIPTAYEILKDKLPKYAYYNVQQQVMQRCKDGLEGTNIQMIDPTAALSAHKEEYIYFRTNHHQTAYGSFYTYQELMRQIGEEPYQLEDFNVETWADDFYGTTWSKSQLSSIEGDKIYGFVPKQPMAYKVNFIYEGGGMDSLYNMENLKKKDKYTVYLDGNHSVLTIHSSLDNGKKLAVFKDSYAHSMLPFLANHYEEIHVLDLRYFSMDPAAYLDENGIRDVAIIYNTANFMTDTNPVKLGAFIK